MAVVDLERRAEIGREKRARTRERLLVAAAAAFARSDREKISVDEIVAAAGVAKGTFYVHFEDIDALWAELAERLTRDYDELLQPRRLSLGEPLERVAYGCAAFLEKGRRNSLWAAMTARAALKRPDFAASARARLLEDLDAVLSVAPVAGLRPELAAEIVSGIVLRAAPLLAGGDAKWVDAAVGAILRAVGTPPARAAKTASKAADQARADLAAQEQAAKPTSEV
jgi:AcrR family transcriptional regulator